MPRKDSRRPLFVFATLLALLTLTSALLLALSPEPLRTDGVRGLLAAETADALDPVFQTSPPAEPGRWTHIYIRHSRTSSGNARTLAHPAPMPDHFLIGNGDGAVDGEIQFSQRWVQQQPAHGIDSAWISICLIGDFDRGVPTPAQLHQLAHLITTLQSRLGIPGHHIITIQQPDSPAAIGEYFPVKGLREQLASTP